MPDTGHTMARRRVPAGRVAQARDRWGGALNMNRLSLFALGLVVFALAGAALWLGTNRPAALPTSQAPPSQFVQDLRPGQRFCISSFFVPSGARSLVFTIGIPGRKGSTLQVTGIDRGSVVFRSGRRFREGQNVAFRIRPPVSGNRVVNLCVRNRGSALLKFAGDPQVGVSARFTGTVTRSWLGSAGSIADRFHWARFAPLGAATMWLALAIALAGSLLAVLTAVIVGRIRP